MLCNTIQKLNMRTRIAGAVLIIGTALLLVIPIYASTYYHADSRAEALQEELLEESKMEWKTDYAILRPDKSRDNQIGIIFYPGGLVENQSYLPLMNRFREEGYTCVLLRMPFHLAIFDLQGAGYAMPDLKSEGVERWYLSGHSLGGVAAQNCYRKHPEDYAGLILMGSYLTKDGTSPEQVLTIYGSNDQVMKRDRVTDKNSTIVELKGGNHGQFGDYGSQAGDGKPGITREEQQNQTVNIVNQFIQK